METRKDEMNDLIIDAIIERPITFEADGTTYTMEPITLGKSFILARLYKQVGLNAEVYKADDSLECLRVCANHSREVAAIIAYAVSKSRKHIFDEERIQRLTDTFEKLDTADKATILNILVASDKSQDIIKHFGIDSDLRDMRRCERAKEKGGSLTFCGKSVWGNLIDWACERYGWTVEYVLWGVSLTTLNMLMSDSVKSVYLSEEERKRVHIASPNDEIITMDNMSVEEFRKIKKELS